MKNPEMVETGRWEARTGRPSWHQRKAGADCAGITVLGSKKDAEDYVALCAERGEPGFVVPERAPAVYPDDMNKALAFPHEPRGLGEMYCMFLRQRLQSGALSNDTVKWIAEVLWVGGEHRRGMQPGTFRQRLIEAVWAADYKNRALLGKVFPDAVGAVTVYSAVENGVERLEFFVEGSAVLACGCLSGYVASNSAHQSRCTGPEGS